MARFIVFHGSSPEASQDELIESAREIAASLAPGTEWLNSWWIAGEMQKLLCEWEAPDEDAIRTSLEPVKDLFPIEAIHEAQWIDPQWYK